jgi:NAD+ synthase
MKPEIQALFSDFNPQKVQDSIIDFLRDNFERRFHRKPFVLGLSGGLDSALAATLVVKANIPLEIMMLPDHFRPDSSSIVNAQIMINYLGLNKDQTHLVDIGPVLDSRCRLCPRPYPACNQLICRGNRAARQRMVELYSLASEIKGVVCGTENLSEHLLGYFTLHGDAASDIEPIDGLLKTEVRLLARFMGVPEEIIAQPPTAGLWEGQTDEGELGFSYDLADAEIKLKGDPQLLEKIGISEEERQAVLARILKTAFKRQSKPTWKGSYQFLLSKG